MGSSVVHREKRESPPLDGAPGHHLAATMRWTPEEREAGSWSADADRDHMTCRPGEFSLDSLNSRDTGAGQPRGLDNNCRTFAASDLAGRKCPNRLLGPPTETPWEIR